MRKPWDKFFLELAEEYSKQSKDPSTRVGCVLTDPYNKVVGIGYNGFPRGVNDTEERLNKREVKYALTIHAELNAILMAGDKARGAIAYVTHPPCSSCTATLIQSGVQKIICYEPEPGIAERFAFSFKLSREICEETGTGIEYVSR